MLPRSSSSGTLPSTKARKSGSVSAGVDAGAAASFGDCGTTFGVFVAGPWAHEDTNTKHKPKKSAPARMRPLTVISLGRIISALLDSSTFCPQIDPQNICLTSLFLENRATALIPRSSMSSSSQPELFPTDRSAVPHDRFGRENQIPAPLGLQSCRAS